MLMGCSCVRMARCAGRSARRLCRRRAHVRVGGEHAASPMPRRRFSRHRDPTEDTRDVGAQHRFRAAATSDPTGLHRVLDDRGRAAPGGPAARHPPRAVARRGPGPGRDAQPRRRVVPPARAQARRGDGDAVRREVLDIVAARGKMQNPVTGSGGMLVGTVEEVGPESPLGLAGRRPGRHPGLADPDPAGDRGRPRALGRPRRAGARRRLRHPLRPLDRRVIPDDLPAGAEPGGDGRLRRARRSTAPGRRAVRRSPSSR